MSLEDDIRLLRNVQMFADFDDEHLRLLSFGSQKMTFPKGHELFREGQHTDGGYVVVSGSVELVTYKDGTTKPLAVFEAGSLIGEIALISVNTRLGTAIVKQDCQLIKITRATMHRILNEYPELAVALHKRISNSVLDFAKDLEKVRL